MPLNDLDTTLPLALRIGITGHRSLSAAHAAELKMRVRAVLQTITEATIRVTQDTTSEYSATPPVFRIISQIAEGADRIVAHEGLAAEYELQALYADITCST